MIIKHVSLLTPFLFLPIHTRRRKDTQSKRKKTPDRIRMCQRRRRARALQHQAELAEAGRVCSLLRLNLDASSAASVDSWSVPQPPARSWPALVRACARARACRVCAPCMRARLRKRAPSCGAARPASPCPAARAGGRAGVSGGGGRRGRGGGRRDYRWSGGVGGSLRELESCRLIPGGGRGSEITWRG